MLEEREKLSIRVPANLKEKIEKISKIKGIPVNAIIVQALWEIVKE